MRACVQITAPRKQITDWSGNRKEGEREEQYKERFYEERGLYTNNAKSVPPVSLCHRGSDPPLGACTVTAIPFIYSFSGNSAASAPISTIMCLWAIYIFPGSVHIFPPAEKAYPSWEYIMRSQTYECGNCDWETPIFIFWEYLFQIFGILSLQCGDWGALV